MCGRFTVQLSGDDIVNLYDAAQPALPLALSPRYNGAPTQEFAACRLDEAGHRAIARLRWGLVPFWAKDAAMGSRLINARAETVHEKPAYRTAFRTRRCLVPASGWFEWQGARGARQPWYIAPADGLPLSFAALWERWDKGEDRRETFTIITTEASEPLADIHHRQPAIIRPHDVSEWLDPITSSEQLLDLVRRPCTGPFEKRPISTRVNNAINDDAAILDPVRPTLP